MDRIAFILALFLSFPCYAGIDTDDVDDFIDSNYTVAVGTGDITIYLRVTPQDLGVATENYWMAYRSGSPVFQFGSAAGCSSGEISIFVRDASHNSDGFCTSGAGLSTGNQYAVIVRYDRDTALQVWVDGTKYGEDTSLASTGSLNGVDFYFGSRNNVGTADSFSDAIINEAAVWNAAISDGAIANLSLSKTRRIPCQVSPGNLLRYWLFDDGADGTSADGDSVRNECVSQTAATGNDGANNTGLSWVRESVLSYP